MRKLNAELGKITLISGERQTGKTTAVLEILDDLPKDTIVFWFNVNGHNRWLLNDRRGKLPYTSEVFASDEQQIKRAIRNISANYYYSEKILFVLDNADMVASADWKSLLRVLLGCMPRHALLMTASDPNFQNHFDDEIDVFYNLYKNGDWAYCFGGIHSVCPDWLNLCDNKFWQGLQNKIGE